MKKVLIAIIVLLVCVLVAGCGQPEPTAVTPTPAPSSTIVAPPTTPAVTPTPTPTPSPTPASSPSPTPTPVTARETQILVEGLVFPECPRWHDGKLWFSDMHAHQVMTVDMEGNTEVIVEVPGQPGGLGWLPDGRLLVVSQADKKLLRLDPDGLSEVADLSVMGVGECNDMVVDARGRAYIGNFGAGTDMSKPQIVPAEIVMVTPEAEVSVVAVAMVFPNGSVITPDGNTLIVAETFGPRLTAFDIDSDGSLTGRRVWANFLGESVYADSICLDAGGAVWLANAGGTEVIRVLEGGEVTDRISLSQNTYACALGGPDGCTLFICTAETSNPTEALSKSSARIETIRVDVPGATPPVAPTSPTEPVPGFKVRGTIELTDEVFDQESQGSLVIEKGTVYLEYHGTLEGTVVKKYTMEVNLTNFQITGTSEGTFTGMVNGKKGTFTFTEKASGQITGPNIGVLFQEHNIVSGTGELSDLRGVLETNVSLSAGGARGLYWGTLSFDGESAAPSTTPTEPSTGGVYAWEKAINHIGETATVTGPIIDSMDLRTLGAGDNIVLGMGKGFFELVGVGIELAVDRALLPADLWKGKTISATGKIYRNPYGGASVLVDDLSKIVIR